ncbi:hypothetical protein HPB47_010042 [Ixodes persulcatus]|uniref:Uncharacterized protein n=1 Tax=Ixodes persulcatus TaxID=34615 RepID=A0AC60P039_IXOPE|nr:hypothetical protein HPB47_010042 [Ixodes persulcatus]
MQPFQRFTLKIQGTPYTAWFNRTKLSQGRQLYRAPTLPISTQAELQAIIEYARDALLTAQENAPLTHLIYTGSQEEHRICFDTKHTGIALQELHPAVTSLRSSGHQVNIRWVPANTGIPGNEIACMLALAKEPHSSSSLVVLSKTIANHWHGLRFTKSRRATYLFMVAYPLSIRTVPSRYFSRREAVLVRQIQAGTPLTPHLLQRFHRDDRARLSPAPGTCLSHRSKADLRHLPWSCPQCAAALQGALASIERAPVPSSLRAWACPDTTIATEHGLALLRRLLMFLRDPSGACTGGSAPGHEEENEATPTLPFNDHRCVTNANAPYFVDGVVETKTMPPFSMANRVP